MNGSVPKARSMITIRSLRILLLQKGERRWSDVRASQGERRSKLREPIKDDLECSVEEGEAGESGPSGSSEGKGRPLQIGRILIVVDAMEQCLAIL